MPIQTINTLARVAVRNLTVGHDVFVKGSFAAYVYTGTLRGTDDEPITLYYLGSRKYFRDFQFFVSAQLHDVAPIFTGNLVQYLLRRSQIRERARGADICIVEDVFRRRRDANAFYLAPYLVGLLKIHSTMDEQLAHIRSKAYRRRLKQGLKAGYAWRISNDADDFELFYRRMYVPTAQVRFADQAKLVSREVMESLLAKQGALLMLEKDGQSVAGMALLLRRQEGIVELFRSGMLDPLETQGTPIFSERTAALEVASLQYAVENGFAHIDMGLTLPLLCNGVFTHKRRLGCDFQPAPYSPRFHITLRPSLRCRILHHHPLVGERQGRQVALVGCPGGMNDEAETAWRALLRDYSYPSLACFHIYTDATADAPPSDVEQTPPHTSLATRLREALADTGSQFVIEGNA